MSDHEVSITVHPDSDGKDGDNWNVIVSADSRIAVVHEVGQSKQWALGLMNAVSALCRMLGAEVIVRVVDEI